MATKKKTAAKTKTKAKTTTPKKRAKREGIHVAPGRGRAFPMGRIHAVFKADGAETNDRYAISEWWLEPWTHGPGPHHHEEDDVFYILEGTMSVMLGDRWVECPKGTFVMAPGGMIHDFENRTAKRAGMLNVSVPGGFEEHMTGIAAWFATHPAGDVAARKTAR